MANIVLTTEQQACINHVHSHKSIIVQARAGCGKTSTLEEMIRETVKVTPELKNRILVTMFNRVPRDVFAKRLIDIYPDDQLGQKNIRTTSSILCMRDYWDTPNYPYSQKQYSCGNLTTQLVVDALKINVFHYSSIIEGEPVSAFFTAKQIAKATIESIKRFCRDKSEKLHLDHVGLPFPIGQHNWVQEYQLLVFELAVKLWGLITDSSNKFPIMNYAILKLFWLKKPRFFGKYKILIVDEFQDISPLWEDIFTWFVDDGGIIYCVGDHNQSIYAFTGAVNAMKSFQKALEIQTKTIAQSFRFGPEVANIANCILNTLPIFCGESPLPLLKGLPSIPSVVGIVDKNKPFTVLCRTNAGVIKSAIHAIGMGKKPFINGKVSELLKILESAYYLYTDEKELIKLDDWAKFTDWKQATETFDLNEDIDNLRVINLVEKWKEETLKNVDKLKEIKNLKERDSDLSICTVHISKGLEWEQVILSNDFQDFFKLVDKKWVPCKIGAQEPNLLYVAATRAVKVLQINGPVQQILSYQAQEQQGGTTMEVSTESKINKSFLMELLVSFLGELFLNSFEMGAGYLTEKQIKAEKLESELIRGCGWYVYTLTDKKKTIECFLGWKEDQDSVIVDTLHDFMADVGSTTLRDCLDFNLVERGYFITHKKEGDQPGFYIKSSHSNSEAFLGASYALAKEGLDKVEGVYMDKFDVPKPEISNDCVHQATIFPVTDGATTTPPVADETVKDVLANKIPQAIEEPETLVIVSSDINLWSTSNYVQQLKYVDKVENHLNKSVTGSLNDFLIVDCSQRDLAIFQDYFSKPQVYTSDSAEESKRIIDSAQSAYGAIVIFQYDVFISMDDLLDKSGKKNPLALEERLEAHFSTLSIEDLEFFQYSEASDLLDNLEDNDSKKQLLEALGKVSLKVPKEIAALTIAVDAVIVKFGKADVYPVFPKGGYFLIDEDTIHKSNGLNGKVVKCLKPFNDLFSATFIGSRVKDVKDMFEEDSLYPNTIKPQILPPHPTALTVPKTADHLDEPVKDTVITPQVVDEPVNDGMVTPAVAAVVIDVDESINGGTVVTPVVAVPVAVKDESGERVKRLYFRLREHRNDQITVPSLVRQIVENDMWRKFFVEVTAQVVEYDSFYEFLTRPAPEGLGSTYRTLSILCQDDIEVQGMLASLMPCEPVTWSLPSADDSKPDDGLSEIIAGIKDLRKVIGELHSEVHNLRVENSDLKNQMSAIQQELIELQLLGSKPVVVEKLVEANQLPTSPTSIVPYAPPSSNYGGDTFLSLAMVGMLNQQKQMTKLLLLGGGSQAVYQQSVTVNGCAPNPIQIGLVSPLIAHEVPFAGVATEVKVPADNIAEVLIAIEDMGFDSPHGIDLVCEKAKLNREAVVVAIQTIVDWQDKDTPIYFDDGFVTLYSSIEKSMQQREPVEPKHIVDLAVRTQEEILGDRTQYIGASEAGNILGVGFQTVIDVWLEKTGRASSNIPKTPDDLIKKNKEYILMGNLFEKPIAEETARRLGGTLQNPQREVVHPDFPFLKGHLDSEIVNSDGDVGILEVKNVSNYGSVKDWGDPGDAQIDSIPLNYYCQVQMLMALSGYQWAKVAVCFLGAKIVIYHINADLESQNDIIKELCIFWNEYVLKDVKPPLPDGNDYATIEALKRNKRLIPKGSKDHKVFLPDSYKALHEEKEQAISAKKSAISIINKVSKDILDFMGDSCFACIPGVGEYCKQPNKAANVGWKFVFKPAK